MLSSPLLITYQLQNYDKVTPSHGGMGGKVRMAINLQGVANHEKISLFSRGKSL